MQGILSFSEALISSLSLSLCLSVYLSICLSVYLSIYLSIYLYIEASEGCEQQRRYPLALGSSERLSLSPGPCFNSGCPLCLDVLLRFQKLSGQTIAHPFARGGGWELGTSQCFVWTVGTAHTDALIQYLLYHCSEA